LTPVTDSQLILDPGTSNISNICVIFSDIIHHIIIMFTRLLLLAGASLAVPLPQQLTLEQFQQKSSRALNEAPSVRISKSYASVRRQGEGGSPGVQFPTLLVRDPNELSRGAPIQKISSAGPVFKPNTLKIQEEIRKINEAELEAREEKEAAEELSGDEELDEITDVIAEEIVSEELEKLDEITDLAAIEMVAEEVVNEVLNEIEDLDILAEADDSENEIIEGSGLPDIDFGSITEVTN